jgi:hypothetical protein
MMLDGVDVKPHDTLVYQPTEGSEVRGEVRHVEEGEGLDVRVEGVTRGLALALLREAEAEGRLRIEPATGRVGEGEVATEDGPNMADSCGLDLPEDCR